MFYSKTGLLYLALQWGLGTAAAQPPGSLNTVIITTGGYVSTGILVTTSSPPGRSFTLPGSDISSQTIPTTSSSTQSTTQSIVLVPTTSESTLTDPTTSPTIASSPLQATTLTPQPTTSDDPDNYCKDCANLSASSYTVSTSSQYTDTDSETTSTLGFPSTDEYGTTPSATSPATSFSTTPSSGTTKSSTWSQYGNHTYSNSSTFSTSYTSTNSSSSQTWITTSSQSQSCLTLYDNMVLTIYEIMPNTTTVTYTTTLGENATFSSTPEFTPPIYCPFTMAMTSTSTSVSSSTTSCRNCASLKGPQPTGATETEVYQTYTSPLLTSVGTWTSGWPWITNISTVITTSKNPVTVLTTVTPPDYGDSTMDKSPVTSSSYSDTYVWGPIPTTGLVTHAPLPVTDVYNEDLSTTTPITETVDGITLVVQAGQAVIGGQTLELGAAEQIITEAGDVFTADSSVVTGPMIIIWVPTNTGAMFMQSTATSFEYWSPPDASTILVSGVSVAVGSSNAVVGGSTFQVGSGAPQQTIVVKGQTISIGSQGVAFASTTIAPQSDQTPEPVNKVVVDPEIISVIGSTLAVIDGTSVTYGPGIPTQVEVVMGQTITIGPSGVSFDGSTLGGPSNIGTQYGVVGGLSIAEIGSSIAVINGQTFTVGPGATPVTATISGHTITIGTGGVGIEGGTTLAYPFNPTFETVTAGGITFSEVIGSSLAVIGGKTFTIGPGATPTTDIINGQTISIGPGGIGFSTTTFTGVPTSSTGVHTSTKSGAGNLRPASIYGVLGICIAMAVGYYI